MVVAYENFSFLNSFPQNCLRQSIDFLLCVKLTCILSFTCHKIIFLVFLLFFSFSFCVFSFFFILCHTERKKKTKTVAKCCNKRVTLPLDVNISVKQKSLKCLPNISCLMCDNCSGCVCIVCV